jgi:hypothetical protein
VAGSNGGGAEEQPRALARGSRELTTSVRSSGRCRGLQRGRGSGSWWLNDSNTTVQWRRWGGGGKMVGHGGGGSSFIAGGGGWQRRREPRAEWWRLGCGQCSLGADVRTVRQMSGPHAVSIFFEFIQNWFNFKNSK